MSQVNTLSCPNKRERRATGTNHNLMTVPSLPANRRLLLWNRLHRNIALTVTCSKDSEAPSSHPGTLDDVSNPFSPHQQQVGNIATVAYLGSSTIHNTRWCSGDYIGCGLGTLWEHFSLACPLATRVLLTTTLLSTLAVCPCDASCASAGLVATGQLGHRTAL